MNKESWKLKSVFSIVLLFLFVWSNAQEDDFFDTNYGVFLEKADSTLLNKIRIIKFSHSEGIIFPAEFADSLISRGKNAFSPDSLIIIAAEKELVNQYCKAIKKFNDRVNKETSDRLYYMNDLKALRNYEKQKRRQNRIRKKYCSKWQNDILVSDKQIIGYINEEGEKILLIKILDFREDPYDLKRLFYTSWIDGWHGWFETNVKSVHYHLKNNLITVNEEL